MAQTATCPELKDFLSANECLENFGGLGVNVYVFLKSDLKAPLKAEKNVYPALSSESFNTGKGLYKFECKESSQGHSFESLGRRGGYKQQIDYVLESVNAASAEVGRALNNLDLGYIFQDGEKNIIVYDPQHKVEYASGGIKGDTGKNLMMNVALFVAALSSLQYTDATRLQSPKVVGILSWHQKSVSDIDAQSEGNIAKKVLSEGEEKAVSEASPTSEEAQPTMDSTQQAATESPSRSRKK